MDDRRIDTGCERGKCGHELGFGVLVTDLLSADGPYPTLRYSGITTGTAYAEQESPARAA
jgi:hypothetical protein